MKRQAHAAQIWRSRNAQILFDDGRADILRDVIGVPVASTATGGHTFCATCADITSCSSNPFDDVVGLHSSRKPGLEPLAYNLLSADGH